MFPAFQGNVAVYVVALLANRCGEKIDFGKIWAKQELSPAFQKQIGVWAHEVNDVLHSTSGGKMISEWAKKAECWECVRTACYSEPIGTIPEVH